MVSDNNSGLMAPAMRAIITWIKHADMESFIMQMVISMKVNGSMIWLTVEANIVTPMVLSMRANG